MLENITELNLRNNHISDEVAKALAEALGDNNQITELNLSGNHISEELLADIGIATILEENKKAFLSVSELKEEGPLLVLAGKEEALECLPDITQCMGHDATNEVLMGDC